MTQEIHEIVNLPFTGLDPYITLKTMSAIPESNGGIMGTGIYTAVHLRKLFFCATGRVPEKYADLPRDRLVHFANTNAAVLCLDILKNQQHPLFIRSNLAASILFKQDAPPAKTDDAFKEMYQLLGDDHTLSPELLVEDTIGYIPYSKAGLRGESRYEAGFLKRLYALAGETVPEEYGDISSLPDEELVSHPNTTAAILCLDAMKKQNIGIEARASLLSLTVPNTQRNLHAPQTADPHL